MEEKKDVTPVLNAKDQALIDALSSITANNTAGGSRAGTSSTTSITKLTPATAKALMTKAAIDAGYIGTFTSDDIADFIRQFDIKQKEQIEKVVVSSASKTTPSTTGGATKAVETTAKTEYPSFFEPLEFAKDFVWSKIDFKDEKKLGAKSLDALSQVRGVLEKFNLLGVSETEAKAAAKQIAMGKKTIAAYTTELQEVAKREYPNLADRFKTDPTLTTYDIASPIINMLAKTWQVDPSTIKMNDPLVVSYLRPGGADGKGVPPSYNELLTKAKKDKKYDFTTEANELARDAATELGRALGAGI